MVFPCFSHIFHESLRWTKKCGPSGGVTSSKASKVEMRLQKPDRTCRGKKNGLKSWKFGILQAKMMLELLILQLLMLELLE